MNGFAPQALDVARKFESKSVRARVLAAVARLLDEELAAETISDALLAARTLKRKAERAVTLTFIASCLENSELRATVVQEALSVVEHLRDLKTRVMVVAQICDKIGKIQCMPALLATVDMVRRFHDAELMISSYAALAPYLPRERRLVALQEALKLVTPIWDRSERDSALAAIGRQWPVHALPEALSFGYRIDDEFSRTQLLSALVPRMDGDLLGQVVAATEAIVDSGCRKRLARTLAPYVSVNLLSRVFELLAGDVDGRKVSPGAGISQNAAKLTDIVGYRRPRSRAQERMLWEMRRKSGLLQTGSSPDSMRYAATYSRVYRRETDYSAGLISLAPRLKEPLLNKALHAGLLIDQPLLRLKVLVAFLPHVSAEARDVVAGEALTTARVVLQDVYDEESEERPISLRNEICVSVFADLIRTLPDHLRDVGAYLLVGLLVRDLRGGRIAELSDVFRRLPKESQRQITSKLLDALSGIDNASTRADVLVSLLAIDSDRQSEIAMRALDSAWQIHDVPTRVTAMVSLIPYLANDMRKVVTQSLVRLSLDLEHEGQRLTLMAQIAQFIDGSERQSFLEEMLIIAPTDPSPTARCQALASLISEFNGDRRHRIFADAVAAARSLDGISEHSRYLLSLVAVADASELTMIVDEASNVSDDGLCSRLVAGLSSEISGGSIPRVLDIAQAIVNEKDRTNALSALCRRLSPAQLNQLAVAVPGIEDSQNRLALIRAMMQEPTTFSRMVGNVSVPFRIWADGFDRRELLDMISSVAWWAARVAGEVGLVEISEAILDVARWWP
jgi:hypothetical protein